MGPYAQRNEKMLTRLRRFSEPLGVAVEIKGEGHFHIKGALLVNYYPFAATQTAYVAGTTKGKKNVSPEEAVAMARKLPKLVKDFKRKSYRNIKLKMLRKSACCHWCEAVLTAETATVDHKIPLSRGGLDNDNNRVLACSPCNQRRGNWMPEISQQIKEPA